MGECAEESRSLGNVVGRYGQEAWTSFPMEKGLREVLWQVLCMQEVAGICSPCRIKSSRRVLPTEVPAGSSACVEHVVR